MSLKVDNFLRPFRGKSDDFAAFWDKFLVLAEISKWDTDAKKMAHFPLFLEGDAFLVFNKFSADDKKDSNVVKAKMTAAFAATPSEAYRRFVSRRLKVDESVDAFVADLQRLLERSGHMLSGDKDAVVIEQLIASLPSDFSKQLRMSLAGKELMISACVEQVRALRSSAADCSVSAGVLEPAAELAAAVAP